MSNFQLVIILFTVALNAAAQLILKYGVQMISEANDGEIYSFSISSIFQVLFNTYVMLGLIIYVVGAGFWIWVLSKVDISLAYPFISLGFILTLVVGVAFFKEPLSSAKIFGTLLIISGCFVITRS